MTIKIDFPLDMLHHIALNVEVCIMKTQVSVSNSNFNVI